MRKLKFYFQFFPVTAQGLLTLAVFFLCYRVLFPAGGSDKEEVNSFSAVLRLLTASVFWFLLFFILFGFVTTSVAWLIHFFRKRRKNAVAFHFRTSMSSGGVRVLPEGSLPLPPFGSVQVRLVYDDLVLTPAFLWQGRRARRDAGALQELALDDVKTYHLKGSFLFFEDLFRIFSLPVYQTRQQRFFRGPERRALEAGKTAPRVAETPEVKTTHLRRIPGDFLNYKTFESGDDIRRIVWKLYAKNRELIVRTPEEKDRYASKVYLYASFHAPIPGTGRGSAFAREMLNFYKHTIWTVYDALRQQELPVKFEPDQSFRAAAAETEDPVRMGLSNCLWQQEMPLRDYFDKRKGSVLILSSMNDPMDLDRLLAEAPVDVKIIMVKLSAVFERRFLSDWVSRIFLRAEHDRLKRIRGWWMFSPLRLPLLRNERALEKSLERTDRQFRIV